MKALIAINFIVFVALISSATIYMTKPMNEELGKAVLLFTAIQTICLMAMVEILMRKENSRV